VGLDGQWWKEGGEERVDKDDCLRCVVCDVMYAGGEMMRRSLKFVLSKHMQTDTQKQKHADPWDNPRQPYT